MTAALRRDVGQPGWVLTGRAPWAAAALQTKTEKPDGTVKKVAEQRQLKFVPWKQAIGASAGGRSLRRISPLFLVLRGTRACQV